MSYSGLLNHPLWRTKRQEILLRDNWTCQGEDCGKQERKFEEKNKFLKLLPEEELIDIHIHHKFYRKNCMPWEQPNSDLIALCEDCHEKHHQQSPLIFIDGEDEANRLENCSRCGGTGYLPIYKKIQNGICFKCRGAKRLPKMWNKESEIITTKHDLNKIAQDIIATDEDINKLVIHFAKGFKETEFLGAIDKLKILINELNISNFDDRFIISFRELSPSSNNYKLVVQIGYTKVIAYPLIDTQYYLLHGVLFQDEKKWLLEIKKEMEEAEDIIKYNKPFDSICVFSYQFRRLHESLLYKAALDKPFFENLLFKIKQQIN